MSQAIRPAAAARRLAHGLWPRRLGPQLKWLVSGVLWASLLGWGAVTIRHQTAQALAGIEQQAAGLARVVALASENPVLTGKLDLVEDLLLEAARLPDLRGLAVLDAQGALLGHVEVESGKATANGTAPLPKAVFDAPGMRWPLPAGQSAWMDARLEAQRVLAWHPIVAGRLVGWVRADMATHRLQALQADIVRDTLLACLVAGLAGPLLVARLLRRPLQAIQQASDLAESLSLADGRQMALPAGPEDTVALARAINQASTRLLVQRQTIDAQMAALRQQEAVLADAHARLQAMFALSPDGLVSLDDSGCVRLANPAFHRLTGLAPILVIDQRWSTLERLLQAQADPDHPWPGLATLFAPHHAAVAAAETGNHAAEPLADRPARLRLVLRQPRPAVLSVQGQRGQTAEVHTLLLLRDITQESMVERMKSEFLSVAAHELRTPMTSIHACLELLRARTFTPERQAALFDIMGRQSTAMVAIVNDLLDLARIEGRQDLDFQLEVVPLAPLLAQAAHDFTPPSGRAPPQWLPPDEGLAAPQQAWALDPLQVQVQVRVDPARLAQVLRNLLSNAYKYSQSGPVQLRLLGPEATPPAPGLVGLAVQDHGIGMTPEQLARVGERFYRADATGHVLGTGLGISIVRELLQRMGGHVAFDSVLGQGTTATVWLPRAAAAAPDSAEATAGRAPIAEAIPADATADATATARQTQPEPLGA